MILLIVIIAAFLAERVNRAHVQEGALSSIKRLNGYVVFDYQVNAQGKGDPATLIAPLARNGFHDLIGPEYFQTIYTVRIHRNFEGSRDPEQIGFSAGSPTSAAFTSRTTRSPMMTCRAWRRCHTCCG